MYPQLRISDSLDSETETTDTPFLRTQLILAKFYAEHVMPRALAYGTAARASTSTLMALTADQF